jgi:hypothetical protein
MNSASVVSGGDMTKMLELVEEALDPMASIRQHVVG